jgi:protein PhnA
MNDDLLQRANNACELCKNTQDLVAYIVEPKDNEIIICQTCNLKLNNIKEDSHWHCLNDSMWSEIDAVKVVVYRIISHLGHQDMLDMMYLEDDLLQWANETLHVEDNDTTKQDANGNTLQDGDTITLIKDLDVKGANFIAKRGTVVKNIRLGNVDKHIEGKINGSSIYLKCDFIKK